MLERPIDFTAANPKTALQEWAQGQGRPLPRYEVVAREGPDHAPRFTVQAVVEGYEPVTAAGRSRQEAEKAAAQALLKREGIG
jgi:ribonuclease-3